MAVGEASAMVGIGETSSAMGDEMRLLAARARQLDSEVADAGWQPRHDDPEGMFIISYTWLHLIKLPDSV